MKGQDQRIMEEMEVSRLAQELEQGHRKGGTFTHKRPSHSIDYHNYPKIEEVDFNAANADLMFEFKPEVHAMIKQQLVESKDQIRLWE